MSPGLPTGALSTDGATETKNSESGRAGYFKGQMDVCVDTFVFMEEGLRGQRKVTKAAESADKYSGCVDLQLCSRVRVWGMLPKIESLS